MSRQPKDVTSLSERLKSAELLMRSNVSKKLTMEDLEALALFITKSQALINDLGKTLNIKPPTTKVTSNNQSYNNTDYSNNTAINTTYQQRVVPINTIVNGSGNVSTFDPKQDMVGSDFAVTAYNPELDFVNDQQPLDMPIFIPSQEQLEAEARLLGNAFNLPEDIQTLDINEFTQE